MTILGTSKTRDKLQKKKKRGGIGQFIEKWQLKNSTSKKKNQNKFEIVKTGKTS
ncbi:MAG: hypothetical protein MRECE_21c005 [Mycoplasmataceae bacterium CE_OT135]|nr:MAG: hypothetical protein MRECE_21c005 [Mycoplasmataceae bacterium CE_OT135]